MCGITGFIDLRRDGGDLHGALRRMTAALVHRGPDDEGFWTDAETGVGLGHRRLSIIDLSPEGHQPMWSTSGRYGIVFNGEIYNHPAIRKKLEGESQHTWRGHSDTEVMLAAIEAWGLKSAVSQFIGMFAFALWDKKERTLYLVRDRLGEKPLYYGWAGRVFLFGSELKALQAHPGWRGEINRNALALFLRHNYIPAPYSIYTQISKLIPGSILTIKLDTRGQDLPHQALLPKPYWQAKDKAEAGIRKPFSGSEQEAASTLERLLLDSIAQEMVADVPLGAFLSGGIDSSTIVALMQAQCSNPVRTFTIGFREKGYDEAEHAKAVAQHLKTDHTELYITPEETMAVIPKMPTLYDEPFSDSSQIPTFLISQLTRKYVAVSLSGDGGDELFGGYTRYMMGQDIWNKIKWMPLCLRKSLAVTLRSLSANRIMRSFQAGPLLKKYGRPGPAGDKLFKLSEVLSVDTFESLYRRLLSHWKEPETVVLQGAELPTAFSDGTRQANLNQVIDKMMYLDMISYLPDNILTKVDRAAMGVSLETRVPFLDHRIVEFAWQVPLSMKIRNGNGKWLLKQLLYKYVPRRLAERPKKGFGVPIDSWLRGPLREWGEALLDEKRLREEGFFDPQPVRRKWAEHLSGGRNWQYYLWDILMFQAWKEYWH